MPVASVLQPVMDNWNDQMVPSQAYAHHSWCLSLIGMFQWLRIEPAGNKHVGTEGIALAFLYLCWLHTWVHVCQQKEWGGGNNLYSIHKKHSKVIANCVGLTDCSGERGSPKPIVNEAIWRELGSCQEKQTSCQWLSYPFCTSWVVVRWV